MVPASDANDRLHEHTLDATPHPDHETLRWVSGTFEDDGELDDSFDDPIIWRASGSMRNGR